MNIAFCYENVLPARGGCETYITDLARRLAADGHEVHLYACRWDERALPESLHGHRLDVPPGPRFLRPWRFGRACEKALAGASHDVTVGFDKTWGQDVLYPQGGLHRASAEHNLAKHRCPLTRLAARVLKAVGPASWSFAALERKQYLGPRRPLVVAISQMTRRHLVDYLGCRPDEVPVVRAAVDPGRFPEHDRPRVRVEARERWGLRPDETVALFAAMNSRLKGLVPLLRALPRVKTQVPFRLLVLGDPRTGRYQRLARRLGVAGRVTFGGFWPAMREAYFAADFLVHPTFYDPCSLVVLEALACGLPIITSRSNGAAELLAPPREGQVLDDPHDHEQLAWAISQLLDPARRAACAAAARQAAAAWTFEHHYRQLLRVFAEAAARKRAA
jgi:UDP-glucose:(heptosyl)LPS alpha-1,3-glucosyltransferase